MPPLARLACLAVLLTATLFVYLPAGSYDFINYDDGDYVSDNPSVSGGLTAANARWALTTFHAANWHPLTWLSHQLDVSLFGVRPGPMHLVNVGLHIASTATLFLVLGMMTGGWGGSLFVAGVFALHPLHVESVAWIAERKDVLSGLIFFLFLGAWLRYLRRPGPGRYLPAGLLLAAKPMLVTAPFLLLVLDGWPFGRLGAGTAGAVKPWRKLLLEKAPLLALSLVSVAVTLVAQSRGMALASWNKFPFHGRLVNSFAAGAGYVGQAFRPTDLRLPHLLTFDDLTPARVALSVAFLLTVSLAVARWRNRLPFLAAGWAWYLGMLVPVIGLVQVGGQAMADRYTYLPLIGLTMMVAWGLSVPLRRSSPIRRGTAVTVAILILGVLGFTARNQLGYWRNAGTLFGHTVVIEPDNPVAHYSLGLFRERRGDTHGAEAAYRQAIRSDPYYAQAHNNLGVLLASRGNTGGAESAYRPAVLSDPAHPEARTNLGAQPAFAGAREEAVRQFEQAIRVRPGHFGAWYNLGRIRLETGDDAVTPLEKAVSLRPDWPEARISLGVALGRAGRFDEAAAQFREALRLNPESRTARDNLDLAEADADREKGR
jgi:Flp pilus assembly protein TadD